MKKINTDLKKVDLSEQTVLHHGSLLTTVFYHLLRYLQPTAYILANTIILTRPAGFSKLKNKTLTDDVKIVQTQSRNTKIYTGNNGKKY